MLSMNKVVLVVALCVCVVTLCHRADGAGNCDQVLTQMQPCRNYLKSGGTVPPDCCKGVDTLNKAATTTAKKRQFCECLKSEAKSYNVNSQYASSLPQKCKVNVGYPISYNTNCNRYTLFIPLILYLLHILSRVYL